MMDPVQIDDLIHKEIADQRSYESSSLRSAEFHAKRAEQLEAMLGCEHEPVKESSTEERCRLCGFRWVRK